MDHVARATTYRPLPSEPTVAVVGATGLVGEVLLRVLDERELPIRELIPMAGPRSVGRRLAFRGREFEVVRAHADAFDGVDLVFFAATGELSRTLAPAAVRAGAVVIDKSATWRLAPEVPLIVPEINGELATPATRLIACPNCTTIGLVMALEPLRRRFGLRRVVVTTLQAASGAGRAGLDELAGATAGPFGGRLAHNALPLCGALEDDGVSTEERKLVLESRKILGDDRLDLLATCTRVPVPVGHGASVWLTSERALSVRDACAALDAFPGVRVSALPTPADAAGFDDVLVGRVRAPADDELQFWQVADNLRKGAATNAVQIAEALLSRANPPREPTSRASRSS